jgi:hypothetical protein
VSWQPIETAPEHMSIMVIQTQNNIIAIARGKNKKGNWKTGIGAMDYIAGVTHWMPLPPPPTD